MEDSEANLPRSTLVKLVRDLLPTDVKVASETQELIVKCSTEFVQLLATQANEVDNIHAVPYVSRLLNPRQNTRLFYMRHDAKCATSCSMSGGFDALSICKSRLISAWSTLHWP